jgi:hypothetical protein
MDIGFCPADVEQILSVTPTFFRGRVPAFENGHGLAS